MLIMVNISLVFAKILLAVSLKIIYNRKKQTPTRYEKAAKRIQTKQPHHHIRCRYISR
jgi:hypothetical protein